jgi:hypothetical protein
MDDKIKIIQEKLNELERKDRTFTIFGSSKHRYIRKGRLYEYEVKGFENRFNIQLPLDYREFILQVTNGGPGPGYGLESLEDGLYQDLNYRRKRDLTNPALEFPLTEAWNMASDNQSQEQYDQIQEEDYDDNKWTNGLLRLSNFGCGISMNLVVNGKEHGNIWADDRCNGYGMCPDQSFGNEGRINFLTWYEAWLDLSLDEIAPLSSSASSDAAPATEAQSPNVPSRWRKTLFQRNK